MKKSLRFRWSICPGEGWSISIGMRWSVCSGKGGHFSPESGGQFGRFFQFMRRKYFVQI
ncbi:hypothetical protein [uncultured Draconibacterium sp.]|uniref:hypothetical protein n=1 Tax=uncultured Draconibacterium sp. TaxID=1573823 RepID=UPI0029C95325|nr:hypothetical protein [uncultured Draconibacterium sp.]